MTVRLTWTIGAGATSQTVRYRLLGASTWTDVTTLNNTINTYDVTGLTAGNHYEFQISNGCNPDATVIKCSYVTNLQYSLSAYNPLP